MFVVENVVLALLSNVSAKALRGKDRSSQETVIPVVHHESRDLASCTRVRQLRGL